MSENVVQKVREIKQSFRQMMDGAVAASMRDKGVEYKLNWGATLPRLREMANEIGQNYDLAIELWKENIRECKILATMIMPPKEMMPEVVDVWMEQTPTLEIAEQASFNLYQHLECAADKAFAWLSSPNELYQICGYHVLSRLFMQKHEPNERDINEFLDQALTALQTPSPILQKAAMQSVVHFAELGLVYERLAHSAIRRIGMNFL
jgi:hypothetical protein